MTIGRLFTYGTLKRGGAFHRDLMRPYTRVARAQVRGKLLPLAQGYLALQVEPEDILAEGRPHFRGDLPRQTERRRPPVGQPQDMVDGELFWVPNPQPRFVVLDDFEDLGKGSAGAYRRVLLWVWMVQEARWITAWVYTLNPNYAFGRKTPKD